MRRDDSVREIYLEALEFPEPFSSLSDADQERARDLLQRFEELEAADGASKYSQLLHPMLLSKNGRYDEAVALTEKDYQRDPSWDTAVAVANAARRAGDLEHAAAMFAKGTEHDPTDVTCWLEVGDIRLNQTRYAEALEAYEKALEKEDTHQWALPSAFYCRHQLGMDGNWLASLREVANQEGCTCGMEGCLTALFGGYGSESGIARAEYLLKNIES